MSWGCKQVKFHVCLMHWQKSLFVLPQTGTYLPKWCYLYLNIKNKTLPWRGISGLPNSKVSFASSSAEGMYFFHFEPTDCKFSCRPWRSPSCCLCLAQCRSPQGCLKGVNHELFYTKKQRRDQALREEHRQKEKEGWFYEGHASLQGTKACLQQRCWLW